MSIVTALRGACALSPFRIQKLQQKAVQIGLPQTQIASEYWYFVARFRSGRVKRPTSRKIAVLRTWNALNAAWRFIFQAA